MIKCQPKYDGRETGGKFEKLPSQFQKEKYSKNIILSRVWTYWLISYNVKIWQTGTKFIVWTKIVGEVRSCQGHQSRKGSKAAWRQFKWLCSHGLRLCNGLMLRFRPSNLQVQPVRDAPTLCQLFRNLSPRPGKECPATYHATRVPYGLLSAQAPEL